MPRRGRACSRRRENLNYAPNQSGRNLRRGTTHAIAFMLQPHPGDQQYGEPFFIPFLTGLQAGLAERGLDLIVVMGAPGDYQQERLRRVVEARWADAVVLAWTRREDERIDYLTNAGFPFATLGRSRSGGKSYRLARSRFREGGRRRGRPPGRARPSPHRRHPSVARPELRLSVPVGLSQGARSGMASSLTPSLIGAAFINESGGYEVTPKLMRSKNPPTAIIFNNDAMALGGCKALVEMGLKPGQDVAVIVIVDTTLCRYFSPTLTSFRPALEPLGRRLAEVLLQSMPAFAGPDGAQIIREVWPLELVARDSD